MSEFTVQQQIHRYLDGEITRSDIHYWVYDNMPKCLEDAIAIGDEDKAFGFLIWALAEYDFDIEYAGFTREKAEVEFRQTLTEYLVEREVKAS